MSMHVENLNQSELEDLVRWFAFRMGPEQRRLLMAERPQYYALLYPHVDAGIILANVRERLGVKRVYSSERGFHEVNVREDAKAGILAGLTG